MNAVMKNLRGGERAAKAGAIGCTYAAGFTAATMNEAVMKSLRCERAAKKAGAIGYSYAAGFTAATMNEGSYEKP
jgi:hypothetical protein